MNDKIKELAEQAWDSTREEIGKFVDDGGEIDWDFLHTYDKKFAELIVRECIDYCGENLSKTVGGALKIHFGVEK